MVTTLLIPLNALAIRKRYEGAGISNRIENGADAGGHSILESIEALH